MFPLPPHPSHWRAGRLGHWSGVVREENWERVLPTATTVATTAPPAPPANMPPSHFARPSKK